MEYKTEFYLHLQPHGALLVDKRSMYYFRLSGEAVEIALLLAKNQSLEKTSRILSSVKQTKITEKNLLDMLDAHPVTQGWKEKMPTLTLTGSTETYIPISCTLQLTNSCNLFCSFCYSSSGKRFESELTANDWIKIMQNLATRGVTDITLTGGEGRLIKNFKQVLITASSLFTNVNLFSNGMNWSPVELELISDLGNVYVQISIDGSEEIHDYLRGKKGAFKESMKTVQQLINRNVPTLIAMTVNPKNYNSIEEVIEQAVSVGANVFRAGLTLPVGRGKDGSFGITKDEYTYVQNVLYQSVEKYGDVIHIPIWNEENSGGCSEFSTPGYLQWYIRADGFVTPCQIENVVLGHIQRDTMEELGNPENILSLHEKVKICRCMSKVNMPKEVDCPHTYV